MILASTSSREGSRRHLLLGRACWALLVAIHVPLFFRVSGTLLAAGPSWGILTGWLPLAITLAFFVLKLVDAPLVRFRCRRTSVVAFILVAAMVHGDVQGMNTAAVVETRIALVASLLVLVELWVRSRRRLTQMWQILKGSSTSLNLFPSLRYVLSSLTSLPPSLNARCVVGPRAPPV